MKYIILFLMPLFIFSNEQRILLTGFTIHEHTNDRFGEKYNAFNYGAGYEYNFFNDYNEFYFATNTLVFNDSFENPQFVVGMGHAYRFDTGEIDTAIGLSGFVGIKKIYTDDDLNRDGGDYGFTGGVGPTVTFYYEKLSVNFVYVPSFSYKDLETTGFLFTYFGYKF
ncbi:MAG: hypothetical protein L0Y61_02040 [Epsilonproteobacteria bacterium]|nr:hypothetical protein [Campylobacterota bacterium]